MKMKRRRKKKSQSLTVAVNAFNFEKDKTEKVGDIIWDGKTIRASDPENGILSYSNSESLRRAFAEVRFVTSRQVRGILRRTDSGRGTQKYNRLLSKNS
jgi:hypothetical protein